MQNYQSQIQNKLEELRKSDILNIAKEKISSLLESKFEEDEFLIDARMKTTESCLEKITRKGYHDISQITDLIGVKVTAKSVNDVAVMEGLIKDNCKWVSVNNYYTEKRIDGYKSIHIDIKINEIPAEIQIKDAIESMKQDICHSHIYKAPIPQEIKTISNQDVNIYLDKFLKDKNYTLGSLLGDNDFKAIQNEIRNILIKNLKHEYSKDFPEIKFISKESAEILLDLNLNRKNIYSFTDIKKNYMELGKKKEQGSNEADQLFKKHEKVVSELKNASLELKAEQAKENIPHINKVPDKTI